VAYRVAVLLRQQSPLSVHVLAGLGHLAHEEQPGAIAPLVLAAPA
jgi:pimeloyl-ACP methyl ester carboxylesterase